MKEKIDFTINIPEGVELELNRERIIVKKQGKEITKKIPISRRLKIKIEDKIIKIHSNIATRKEKAMANTLKAHINNIFKGLNEPYSYKLEIANVHFPMNVKAEGDRIIIKNFLGEKIDRMAKIIKDVEVKIKGSTIELTSHNKDAVGQTAANLERATKVANRDRRVFQDGIFITEKAGVEI
jgi:large subunit ribosomal protein L6